MTVCDNAGHPVPLGAEIGRGGEGVVFAVEGRSDLVAKLYHSTISAQRADKLRLMSHLRTEELLKIAAWPISTLHRSPSGPVVGILMPNVTGYRKIHDLYVPKSRMAEFPSASWRFLMHTAANLARAFSVVHKHQCVIGDVNPENIVVSQQATVKLVDCDSFQMHTAQRYYFCEVGVPTHQPPEMLSLPSFRGVVRTPVQDNFGLAVIIFQLLMMGRHPFVGRYLGTREMMLEDCIKEHRFAYGNNAVQQHVKPPPHALSLEVLSDRLAAMFHLAFLSSGATLVRPSADDWIEALEGFAKVIKPCVSNEGHAYYARLRSCPLCEIEAKIGASLFVILGTISQIGQDAFDLSLAWARIEQIQAPGALPGLPSAASLRIPPASWALQAGQRRRLRNVLGAAIAILGIALLLISDGFWYFLILTLVGSLVADVRNTTGNKAKLERDQAYARWKSIEQEWQVQTRDVAFVAKKKELQDTRDQLTNLPKVRQERLNRLEAERRSRELRIFLERHRIRAAVVDGIGPGRTATLESYGIETAADVVMSDIYAIPGFGTTLTASLMAWRRSVERAFAFDAKKGISARDIAALDTELAIMRQKLQQRLLDGPTQLATIAEQVVLLRKTCREKVDRALTDLAQAEANLEVV